MTTRRRNRPQPTPETILPPAEPPTPALVELFLEPAAASVPARSDPRVDFVTAMTARDRARLKHALETIVAEASTNLLWIERNAGTPNSLGRLVMLATEAVEMETRIRVRTEAAAVFAVRDSDLLPPVAAKAPVTIADPKACGANHPGSTEPHRACNRIHLHFVHRNVRGEEWRAKASP